MLSTTVRISDMSRKTLKELAARKGESIQSILEKSHRNVPATIFP